MKAAIVNGPDESPVYGEFAEPEPDSDDSRMIVDMVAVGLHPVTKSIAAGHHYGSSGTWPVVPGVDCVARTADGRLIYTGYAQPPYGTAAERISVPAGFAVPIPDAADPALIAGGLNPGLSSWLLVRDAADLDSVLVLGATGTAGRMAVQNAALQGARRVVAAGRNREVLDDVKQHGATDVVAIGGEGMTDAASFVEAFGGEAPTLVLDYLWGTAAESAFEALGSSGLDENSRATDYVHIGSMAGAKAAVPGSMLRSRPVTIRGSGAGSASTASLMQALPDYVDMLASGRVGLPVTTFPLSDIAAAWEFNEPGARAVVVPA